MWRRLPNVLGGRTVVPPDPDTPPDPPQATVAPLPDLVGLSLMEARRQARLASQRVYTIEKSTEQGSWGQVLEQQPAPGAAPDDDGILVLTVGARPSVIVPDVRGRSEDEALAMLREAGLGTTRRVVRRSDKVPEGHVVRTRPRAGAEVPAGSRISCVLAAAPRPSGRERHGEKHRVRATRLPDGSFGRSSGS